MALLYMDNPRFKKAVMFSIVFHITLLLVFILSPYLPDFSNKRTIYYVDFMGGGGGGGGNGGNPAASLETETTSSEEVTETEALPRESLKDLSVPDSLEQKVEPKLRHPTDNPKREPQTKPKKKAVIQKTQQKTTTQKPTQKGTGISSGGVSLGDVAGSGGGSGGGFGPGTGGGSFPYSYYFELITRAVAQNWYTYQIRSGISGNFTTIVSFRIFRDGSTGGIRITETSGLEVLDRAARKAVQNSKFPKLPPALDEDYIIINLLFEHKR